MSQIRNCAKAILIQDSKILAVKYADEGGEYYALPGGKQLHGETLPQALIRECMEELGISARNLGLKFIREYIGKHGESSWRDANVHQVEFMYECEIVGGDDPRGGIHQDHAQVDIAWLPIDSLADYRFYPKKLIGYLQGPLPLKVEYWGNAE